MESRCAITTGEAKVDYEILEHKLWQIQAALTNLQAQLVEAKSVSDYIKLKHDMWLKDSEKAQPQGTPTQSTTVTADISTQTQEVVTPNESKPLPRENTSTIEIDWKIIKTLEQVILVLPTVDWSNGILIVSEEAFKAGAHSIFCCFNCKQKQYGCNLVRCQKGHLICQECFDKLECKQQYGGVYFLCKCESELSHAFGDDQQVVTATWGYGVSRKIGRVKPLRFEHFKKMGPNLDCR